MTKGSTTPLRDIYYKFAEPNEPPKGSHIAGFDYLGFRLLWDREYTLWTIENLDGTEPAIPLRGKFTHQTRAKKAIEDFLADEANKQEKANARRN